MVRKLGQTMLQNIRFFVLWNISLLNSFDEHEF
jgi:hypothetical protein